MNQIAVVVLLKDLSKTESSKECYLMCIVTHLKSKEQFEKERVMQIKQLLSKIDKDLESLKTDPKYKDSVVAVVLAGDLNTEPHSETIKLILDAKYYKFNSAYTHEGLFTTFKIRDKEYCRTIDYIWYDSTSLELLESKKTLSKEEIGENGLPSEKFPSDHLLLFSKFEFKQS